MNLPVEIVERIIHIHCENPFIGKAKLLDLSVVNLHFYHLLRRYIYRQLIMNVDSTRTLKLFSTLSREPSLRQWVREVIIMGIDMPVVVASEMEEVRTYEDALVGIFLLLDQSPVEKIALVAIPVLPGFEDREKETPFLQRLLNAATGRLVNLRSIAIACGVDLNLTLITTTPCLQELSLLNTQLEVDFPSMSLPQGYSPPRLKRFTYTNDGHPNVYEHWDEEQNQIFTFDFLEHFEFSMDVGNEWLSISQLVLAESRSSLKSLTIEVHDFEGGSDVASFHQLPALTLNTAVDELSGLQECSVLETLHFKFLECHKQFDVDVIQLVDEDDDSNIWVFKGLKPPRSLKYLQIAFTRNSNRGEHLVRRFLNRALPELDQEISENRQSWSGLLSVDFIYQPGIRAMMNGHLEAIPCKSSHMARIRAMGINVTGLSYEEDDDYGYSDEESNHDSGEDSEPGENYSDASAAL